MHAYACFIAYSRWALHAILQLTLMSYDLIMHVCVHGTCLFFEETFLFGLPMKNHDQIIILPLVKYRMHTLKRVIKIEINTIMLETRFLGYRGQE